MKMTDFGSFVYPYIFAEIVFETWAKTRRKFTLFDGRIFWNHQRTVMFEILTREDEFFQTRLRFVKIHDASDSNILAVDKFHGDGMQGLVPEQ